GSGGLARAQDVTQQVDVHGFYYKETSTRVVQPRMEVLAQIPRTSTLVGAEYSLDAISSASIAAGNRVSDNILTEYRNQVGARVVQSLNRLRLPVPARVGANYLRSRESDYDSDTVGGQASVDLFERNTTWTLAYSHSFDTVYDRPRRTRRDSLDTDFLSLSVAQLLSPTSVGVVGFEYAYLNGFQQNPYRTVATAGNLNEVVPLIRNRYTAFGRVAKLLPASGTTVQAIYRFYHDDWGLNANTLEGRLYQDVTPNLDVRLAYRYYTQGHAYFAKARYDTRVDQAYTSDPKLFAFDSHYIEGQARLHLSGLHGLHFWGWFENGFVEATFGVLYSGSTFGNCGPLDPTHECADKFLALGLTLPL